MRNSGCRKGRGENDRAAIGAARWYVPVTGRKMVFICFYTWLQSGWKLKFKFPSFWTFPGRSWPRDRLKQVQLEKWCRMHPKSSPETTSKAIWWPCSGPSPKKLKCKMPARLQPRMHSYSVFFLPGGAPALPPDPPPKLGLVGSTPGRKKP